MKKAIFPGSFDPFTRGHQALVEEALTIFDEVVIAIGENVSKQSLLSLQSRMQMIENVYQDNPRVKCMSYSTLTGDFAQSIGAEAIIRGVRNTIDFEYERTMAQTNKRLYPTLTTIILLTPPELADVSSSMVRELLKFGHDVSEFIPQGVDLQKYTGKQ
ncbi:MAG: pantetheine-phosphate adenylyltransferase [Alistipes sp.]|nr:pantetheine-phosphate adenylyltransferase [Alistipes sp.]